MMFSIKNAFFVLCLLSLSACSVSSDQLPDQEQLRRCIAESIKFPFSTQDTFTYSFAGMCGNSSQDELDRYYEPPLNKPPYADILKKNNPGTILFTSEPYTQGMISFTIAGSAIDNHSVEIYEQYHQLNTSCRIVKTFTYVGNKWTYAVTDKHTDTN